MFHCCMWEDFTIAEKITACAFLNSVNFKFMILNTSFFFLFLFFFFFSFFSELWLLMAVFLCCWLKTNKQENPTQRVWCIFMCIYLYSTIFICFLQLFVLIISLFTLLGCDLYSGKCYVEDIYNHLLCTVALRACKLSTLQMPGTCSEAHPLISVCEMGTKYQIFPKRLWKLLGISKYGVWIPAQNFKRVIWRLGGLYMSVSPNLLKMFSTSIYIHYFSCQQLCTV